MIEEISVEAGYKLVEKQNSKANLPMWLFEIGEKYRELYNIWSAPSKQTPKELFIKIT